MKLLAPMRNSPALLLVSLASLASLAACRSTPPSDADAAQRVRGPLPLRENGPLKSTFLAMRPRRALTQAPETKELEINAAYSSTFEVGEGGGASVSFDGEILRTGALLRAGVVDGGDVSIEIPFVYASKGFLDVFIETWHSVLNLPDGGREDRPRFDYDMDVSVDGEEIWHLEGNRLALGDVPIVWTQRVVAEDEGSVGVAVRAGLELPTGSESRGFGNGGFDFGGGVLLEKSLGDFTLTGGADYVFTHRPSSFVGSGVDAADLLYVNGGLEWRCSDSASLFAGLRYTSESTRDIGIEEIGDPVLELDLGVLFDAWEGAHWALGFSEDVIAASGPDFTAFAGLSTQL